MKSFSSDCYNTGLFTILSVVLKKEAIGHEEYRKKAIESWENLGINRSITEGVLIENKNNEEVVQCLTNDIPEVIQKGFNENGKLLYQLGFWGGMFFLGNIVKEESTVTQSIKSIRLTCAQLGNPEKIVNTIQDFEKKISNNEEIDPIRIFEFVQENHFWAIGNCKIDAKESRIKRILPKLLKGVPYVGDALEELSKQYSRK